MTINNVITRSIPRPTCNGSSIIIWNNNHYNLQMLHYYYYSGSVIIMWFVRDRSALQDMGWCIYLPTKYIVFDEWPYNNNITCCRFSNVNINQWPHRNAQHTVLLMGFWIFFSGVIINSCMCVCMCVFCYFFIQTVNYNCPATILHRTN